jgi:hypothetical protein
MTCTKKHARDAMAIFKHLRSWVENLTHPPIIGKIYLFSAKSRSVESWKLAKNETVRIFASQPEKCRKLHLTINPETQEIEAEALTGNSCDDAGRTDDLLDQVKMPLINFMATELTIGIKFIIRFLI